MTTITPPRVLLWVLAPEATARYTPDAFVTAAPRAELSAWLHDHPWARDRPIYRFATADEVDAVGRRGERFLFGDVGDALAGVIADGSAHRPPTFAPCVVDSPTSPAAITAAIMAAQALSAHRPRARIWEIRAEHTDGTLAMALASLHGFAVAQAIGTPGPLSIAVSSRLEVAVRVVVSMEQMRQAIELDRKIARG